MGDTWRSMVPYLEITPAEKDSIERDYSSEERKKHEFLLLWSKMMGQHATYTILLRALLAVGDANTADEVCNLLQVQIAVGYK